MKIRLLENHMTAVEIKLAHAILANSTEIGAMAKSPRKAMELVAIDKTQDTWTAKFRIEDTAGEMKNKARTVKVEIYGEGVVAMPSQETAATETVETATPAVETTTADNTAPAAELKMPFNPMQNTEMFHNQIREFLGCPSAEIVVTDGSEGVIRHVIVNRDNGVHIYEVARDGEFYKFTPVDVDVLDERLVESEDFAEFRQQQHDECKRGNKAVYTAPGIDALAVKKINHGRLDAGLFFHTKDETNPLGGIIATKRGTLREIIEWLQEQSINTAELRLTRGVVDILGIAVVTS